MTAPYQLIVTSTLLVVELYVHALNVVDVLVELGQLLKHSVVLLHRTLSVSIVFMKP